MNARAARRYIARTWYACTVRALARARAPASAVRPSATEHSLLAGGGSMKIDLFSRIWTAAQWQSVGMRTLPPGKRPFCPVARTSRTGHTRANA
eukprot:COSAG02_NODE_1831_length_10724_cov_44.091859_13_plen_93_part_01